MNRPPGSYSALERLLLRPLRGAAAPIFVGIARVLQRLGVTPNVVSLAQIPVGILVAWQIGQNPVIALGLFIFALLLDGIDGTLARVSGRASAYGALVDQCADHVRELTVIAGFAAAGLLSGGVATMYAAAYPLLNALLWIGDRQGRPAPVSAKVWLTFYPFFALWALSGINWLEVSAAITTILLLLSSAWQLWLLRSSRL